MKQQRMRCRRLPLPSGAYETSALRMALRSANHPTAPTTYKAAASGAAHLLVPAENDLSRGFLVCRIPAFIGNQLS